MPAMVAFRDASILDKAVRRSLLSEFLRMLADLEDELDTRGVSLGSDDLRLDEDDSPTAVPS
jgi:hypothetical protein